MGAADAAATPIAATNPAVPLPADAAWVTDWAQALLTADALSQARTAVTSASTTAPATIGGHQVTMTEPLRAAMLDAVRRQVMTRVVAVRAPLRTRLASAANAAARRDLQNQMRDAAAPFLAELRAYPGARYEADPVVQNEVLAAITLAGEGHAEHQLEAQNAGATHADREAAAASVREQTRRAAHLPTGAWCGAFAFASQQTAGLGDQARTALHATGNGSGIDALLDYQHRQEVIWTGSEWRPVQDYHKERGSLRRLVRLPRTPTQITPDEASGRRGLDIRPGDIVLIDNARGTFADHITQCRSYDPATGALETIGGNERGGEGYVAASPEARNLNRNPAAQTVEAGQHKASRVYAYGRFSIVDYETHVYHDRMPRDPHQSPEALAAAEHGPHH